MGQGGGGEARGVGMGESRGEGLREGARQRGARERGGERAYAMYIVRMEPLKLADELLLDGLRCHDTCRFVQKTRAHAHSHQL